MVRKLFVFNLSHLSLYMRSANPWKDSYKEHIIKIFLSTRVVSIYCQDDEQINNDCEHSSTLRILRWKSKLFRMSSETVEWFEALVLKRTNKSHGVSFGKDKRIWRHVEIKSETICKKKINISKMFLSKNVHFPKSSSGSFCVRVCVSTRYDFHFH